MILTGSKIHEMVEAGKITISPFSADQVTTNSYDLRLGKKLIKYTGDCLDPKTENPFNIIEIPDDGYFMQPGSFLLGSSQEVLGSDHYVPIIHAKSSTARRGLFVHITADLVDIGYKGNVTFQLYATLPVKLYANMLIGQVTFWQPVGKIDLYDGKYQNSLGPRVSEINKDFRPALHKE